MNSLKFLLLPVVVVPVLIAGLHLKPLSYLYCLAREDSWLAAKTEREMEQRLVTFYSKRQIDPAESGWGKAHRLQEGHEMIQYLILGNCPLDVVYSEQGAVVAIYTSYE